MSVTFQLTEKSNVLYDGVACSGRRRVAQDDAFAAARHACVVGLDGIFLRLRVA